MWTGEKGNTGYGLNFNVRFYCQISTFSTGYFSPFPLAKAGIRQISECFSCTLDNPPGKIFVRFWPFFYQSEYLFGSREIIDTGVLHSLEYERLTKVKA